jgi:hypothetical protein
LLVLNATGIDTVFWGLGTAVGGDDALGTVMSIEQLLVPDVSQKN